MKRAQNVGRIGVLALILSSGCGGNPSRPSPVGLGEPFELRLGARATVAGGVSLLFANLVSDSRCPIDATCVSAGEALVDVIFLIAPEGPPPRSISLQATLTVNGVPFIDGQPATVPWCAGGNNHWDCRLSTAAPKSSAGARAFTVRLVDLKPHPHAVTPVVSGGYVGTFVITPR